MNLTASLMSRCAAATHGIFISCIAATTVFILSGFSCAEEMTAESLLKSYVAEIKDEDADVTKALAAFKQRQFKDARKHLQAAVNLDPRLPPPGLLLARMFYAASRPAEARDELERVSRDHPSDPGPSLIFGESALAGRRYSEAELAFNKAADLARQMTSNQHRQKNVAVRIQQGLAGVAEAREDWATASKFLRSAVDADPKNASNVVRLARSLFKQGEHTESLKLIQKQWESDKESFQRPEISAALLFQQADDKKRAAELMKLAAKRDSDNEATQRFVAQWALEAGDFEFAQACADQAILVSNSSPASRLTAALVARYRNEYDVARELLESVHLELPTNLTAVTELALVLGELDGMESRSLRYAQLSVQLRPNLRTTPGRNAGVAVAWLLYRFGSKPQAEQILQQALSSGSISAESSYLAAVMLESSNPKAAKKLLDAAIRSGIVFHKYEHAQQLRTSLP